MALGSEVVGANKKLAAENKASTQAILAKNKGQIPPDQVYTKYHEAAFRPTAASRTGAELGYHARDTGTHTEGERVITKELHARYSQFLKVHVQKLYENPGLLTVLQKSPDHSYQYKLAVALARTDEKGKPVMRKFTNPITGQEIERMDLDEDKLKRFFDSNTELGKQGWAITTQLLEHETSYQLLAEDLSAVINPRGTRELKAHGANLDMGRGSGPWAESYERAIDWLRGGLPEADGRHGKIPRVLALAPAVALLPYTIWHELTKRGIRIKFQEGILKDSSRGLGMFGERADLKAALKDVGTRHYNEVDYAYLKVFHGIDLRNPENNTVASNSERRKNLIGNIQTRYMFLESIGVPKEQIEALPEQRFFQHSSPEQTATYWDIAVNVEYQRLLAHALTINNFNVDETARVRLYRKARVAILSNEISALIDNRDRATKETADKAKKDATREKRENRAKERARKIEEERIATVNGLAGQITARESATPVIKESQRLATERKTALEEKRNKVSERAGKVQTDELAPKVQAREQAEKEFSRIQTRLKVLYAQAGIPQEDIDEIPTDPILSIDKHHECLDRALSPDGLPSKILDLDDWEDGQLSSAKEIAEKDANNKRQDALTKYQEEANDPGATDEDKKGLRILYNQTLEDIRSTRNAEIKRSEEQISKRRDAQKLALEKTIQELEAATNKLEAARTAIETARSEEARARREQSREIPNELSLNQRAFERLNPDQDGQLSIENYRDWSVEDIFKFMTNPANQPPYNFVPTTYEEQLALKEEIIRAKADIQTEFMLSNEHPEITDEQTGNYLVVIRASDYDFDGRVMQVRNRIVDPVTNTDRTITQEDLLKLSKEQLFAKLKTYPASEIGAYDDDELRVMVNDAVNLAALRLRMAEMVYPQLAVDFYDAEIAVQDRLINVDFKAEKNQLEVTKQIAEKQGQIFADSNKIVKERAKYTDQTPITAADTTYREAERALGAPKGYYELLQLLTNYQDNVSERERLFVQISGVLPPAKIAGLLNQELVAFAPMGVAVNINTVLSHLNNLLGLGIIGKPEVQQITSRIINQLVKEANALG